MTDKMLSAEKVKEWLDSRKTHSPVYGVELKLNMLITELVGAIDCGQLDADCPKCGGSGRKPWLKNYRGEVEMTTPCDCPAGTGGSET